MSQPTLATLALYFVRNAKTKETISALYKTKAAPTLLAMVVAKKRSEGYEVCSQNIWDNSITILDSY